MTHSSSTQQQHTASTHSSDTQQQHTAVTHSRNRQQKQTAVTDSSNTQQRQPAAPTASTTSSDNQLIAEPHSRRTEQPQHHARVESPRCTSIEHRVHGNYARDAHHPRADLPQHIVCSSAAVLLCGCTFLREVVAVAVSCHDSGGRNRPTRSQCHAWRRRPVRGSFSGFTCKRCADKPTAAP